LVKKFGNDLTFDGAKTIIAGQRGLLLSIKNIVNQQKEIERIVGHGWGEVIYEAERKAIKEAVPQIVGVKELDMLLKNSKISKKAIIQNLIGLFNQTGLGLLKLSEFNEKNSYFIVTVENSPIPEEYEKRDAPVCFHLAGIFAGAAEAIFMMPMICKEVKCVSMGHQYCEFKIMKR